MRLILALVLCVPNAVLAQSIIAQNGMRATRVSETEIAVGPRARARETDYWCAAGDYVVRVMGLPNRTRIWRATPQPRRAGEGVLFTLDQAKKAEGAGLSQYGSGPRDGSISAGMAIGNYCRLPWRLWD
ncbi:MAG: hypothetical protein ACK5M4_08110 [Pseudorhodobacter sp.]